jgi:hypothetical protein
MDRRSFLKILFTGSTYLALRRFSPLLQLRAQEDEEGTSLWEIYGGLSRRLGGETVSSLRNTRTAQRMREDTNTIMGDSGFRVGPDGNPIEDMRDLSDLPRNYKFIHNQFGNDTEVYPLGIDLIYYNGMAYVPMPDICVAWFVDYAGYDAIILLEGPAILGAGVAAAEYAYEEYGARRSSDLNSSEQHGVSQLFLPSAQILPAQVGLGGTFASPEETSTIYQNLMGGEVSVNYSPPTGRSGQNAGVNITATDRQGRIKFEGDYEFDLA